MFFNNLLYLRLSCVVPLLSLLYIYLIYKHL